MTVVARAFAAKAVEVAFVTAFHAIRRSASAASCCCTVRLVIAFPRDSFLKA
jgi:hypothetical protein